jgi:hypothetical protein
MSKNRLGFIIGILFIILVPGRISAQQFKKFSGNPKKYADELFTFFKKNNKEDVANFINEFAVFWDTLHFSNEEKVRIMAISNKLLDKKAKPDPSFMSYLQLITDFKNKNHPVESYITWEKGLNSLLENKRAYLSQVNQYLTVSSDLLNKGILFHNASLNTWKVHTSGFHFEFNETIKAIFDVTDLVCLYERPQIPSDSIIIYNTKGVFYLMELKWEGNSGTVDWRRSGFKPSDVNAKLLHYSINLNKSEYKVDSAIFTNKNYFSNTFLGSLQDKVMGIKSSQSTAYPYFISYDKHVALKNLYDKISFIGGIAMKGINLMGVGTEDELAKLMIYRDDTLTLVAAAKNFVFTPEKAVTMQSEITIYIDKDSIFHPDLIFNYIVKTKELGLQHNEDFISQSPFVNSYHQMAMDFEQLRWKIDEKEMFFTMVRGTAQSKAYFESLRVFNQHKFDKLQGQSDVHPLMEIKDYLKNKPSLEFSVKDLADYMAKPVYQVRQLLMKLAVNGYVIYNENTDLAKAKPRLFEVLKANAQMIDYDVIDLVSTTNPPQENASLNLLNKDIKLNGIPQIFLSDSQNVVIKPRMGKVILKRNRNFQFDGVVNAGLFTFYGKNFFFNYDSFKINLQKIDSLSIRFISGHDNFGKPTLDEVKNIVEHVTGELLIDRADNKSGRKNYPEYPMFSSRGKSYIYYDYASVKKNLYPRDSFYFEIYPYTFDSLDNFTKKALAFKGRLLSAGIFPPINYDVSIQSDNSLGFKIRTDSAGIVAYRGKGSFYNEIELTNKGLRGNGRLDYITSSTRSSNFLFCPDSTVTLADNFRVAPQKGNTQFPQVNGKNINFLWLPKKDLLKLKQDSLPFAMYNKQSTFSGKLELTPGGLTGDGLMDLTTANLKSDKFVYQENDFDADSASFKLKSLKKEGFTVLADNLKSHIDLASRKGVFASNKAYTKVEFPENKYLSYLDYFVWKMDKKELEMGSKKMAAQNLLDSSRKELTGPRYVSTHADQDSLSFVAPLAYYNYEYNIIDGRMVPFIRVADALLYPDSGRVVVEENARMRTLRNAKIVANEKFKFHQLFNAELNVQGRKHFTGKADYNYIDELEKAQVIHFNDIMVDTSLTTIAKGMIVEPDSFTLSPDYGYQGKVTLKADEKYLTFDGAAKIKLFCDQLHPSWIAFKCSIDPKNILIPVAEQPMDLNRNKIYAGPFIAKDSIHIYTSFLSRKKVYNDILMAAAQGFLRYHKDSLKYEITSKGKLENFSLPDNYVCLNRMNCKSYAEGKIDLGVDVGQVKMNAYGMVSRNLEKNETRLNVTLALDFFMDEKSTTIMANEIDSFPHLTGFNMASASYSKTLNMMAGKENAKKLMDELGLYGSFKTFPEEIKHTLVLSDLKLKWSDANRSYRSYGKIGVSSILKTQINKMVDGYVEITRKRSGDVFDIYLELDKNHFYYFGYTTGVMQVLTTNKKFINSVDALKVKQRMVKVKRSQTPYIYLISADEKYRRFLSKFRRDNELEENPDANATPPDDSKENK